MGNTWGRFNYVGDDLGITAQDLRDSKFIDEPVPVNVRPKGVNVMDAVQRISGTEIAGNPYEAIEQIAQSFMNTHIDEHSLKNLKTFEEVMVGTFLLKFHLMRYKQQKYGKMNISEAGLPGLVTRMRDKFERAKNMVGDPTTQISDVKKIILDTPEDATPKELMDALDAIWVKVNPQEDTEESLTDTAIDIGNYGDIFYMVLNGAWGKDMLDD